MKNKDLTLKQLEQKILEQEQEELAQKPKQTYKRIEDFFNVEIIKKEYVNNI